MIGRVVRLIMSAVIAFLLTGVAVAEEKTPRRLTVPSDEALAIMIKTMLIAYNDANLTGNYTVLRDLASPSFREANSSASLAEIFKDMRQKKIDIAPIVLFQPKLVKKPLGSTRMRQVQLRIVDVMWALQRRERRLLLNSARRKFGHALAGIVATTKAMRVT